MQKEKHGIWERMWKKLINIVGVQKRNILLDSCFYDSDKAEQELEEYMKKTGLSLMEVACGIEPKSKNDCIKKGELHDEN